MPVAKPPHDPDDVWAGVAEWGTEPELNELEALMWRTERHPSDSWTGVVIEVLDKTPDWEVFRRATERALTLVPRFRQRVVDPAVPVSSPVWAADPDFDLDYHLRRARLPEPGTMRQLLDLAHLIGVVPLDRRRPPWVRTFVEGLEGGRCALLLQAHHVLMDGMGYAQLMGRLYSPTREAATGVPERPVPAGERPDAWVLAGEGLARRVTHAPGAAARLLRAAGSALSDPRGSVRYAGSMRRVLTPPRRSGPQPLRRGSRKAWRYGVAECGLADMKAAGRSAGGSVNDAFVAALLRGIARYHVHSGARVPGVTISMPVSVRRPEDPAGGNRFTGAFFEAPFPDLEPADLIRAIRSRVDRVRGEPALDFIGALTPVMNRMPSVLVGAALRKINESADITLSNWPGVPHPVYLLGAEVERMYVFGPLPGTAMCAALNSHAGTCCVGMNVDGEVFEDTDALWRCMQEGLDEVLALAKPARKRGARATAGTG